MGSLKLNNRSNLRGKASQLPSPVDKAVRKLGEDLALARRRRRLTQASMAERINASVASVRRLEHGDAGVSLGMVAQALFVLGEIDKLNTLLDTANDDIGLALMNQDLPQRIRATGKKPTGAL